MDLILYYNHFIKEKMKRVFKNETIFVNKLANLLNFE